MPSSSPESPTLQFRFGGRAIPLHVGRGLLERLAALLGAIVPTRQAVIITDENVARLHLPRARRSLEMSGLAVNTLVVPPGDASKSLATVGRLYDGLAEHEHARDEPILALGGGMVGDLAGFVAATWHRGVSFVQCPTTLEACIDAAIGGKTAINHAAGKNLIGAFHQPALIVMDLDCLATLDDRDYRSGLAESIKHAVIADSEFLAWHESSAPKILARDAATLERFVTRNCLIKGAIVAADERETSAAGPGRAALNFGHTFGHAIESALEYELRHGEAVAIGMVAELSLAVALCGFPSADRDRVAALIAGLGLPTTLPRGLDPTDLMNRIRLDKKVRDGRIRFAVPSAIGVMQWLSDPPAEAIRTALRSILPAAH